MNELKVRVSEASSCMVEFDGLAGDQLATAAELIRASKGKVVFDSPETYDTPFGRNFAAAVLRLLEKVSGRSQADNLRVLGETGRRGLVGPNISIESVAARLRVKGGGNSVNFILAPLNLGQTKALEALCAELETGAAGYVPTVQAPVGAEEVILRQGHAEYRITFGPKGPKIKAIPYRMPAAGEKWGDSAGNEYLITEGAQVAIDLKRGAVVELTDGAPAGSIRGVSFVYVADKVAV